MTGQPTTTYRRTRTSRLAAMLARTATIGALLIVLAGCGAASPGTTLPGDGGGNGDDGGDNGGGGGTPAPAIEDTIAYVRSTPAGDEIRLVAPDGTGDRPLWPMGGMDPEITHQVTSLAWRPDGRSLAFTSSHEMTCSWYHVDAYVVRSDGAGVQRVTNAPECAALADLPTGRVTVGVYNASFSSGLFQVYVQGATSLEQIALGPGAGGTVTFEAVADLGDRVQPAVVILGGYRWMGGAAADVQSGGTVHAGEIIVGGEGVWHLGADGVVWHEDGEQLGYVFGECAQLSRIAVEGDDGSVGTVLLSQAENGVDPCAMDWGRTEATKDAYLYVEMGFGDDRGIYLTTEGDGVGTRLVPVAGPGYGEFVDHVGWLSDGSGFLFSGFLFPEDDPFDYDYAGNLYRYDLASDSVSRVTSFTTEFVRAFSVAPDGDHVVFELQSELGREETDLWIVGLDGSGLRLLVQGATAPAWSR